MPTGDRVFESTNTVGTSTKYSVTKSGGSTTGVALAKKDEGLCKALAVLWCANILSGVRDLLTKPDEFRAGALQVRFEMAGWDSPTVFGLAGLESTEDQEASGSVALDYMIANPGTYQIRVPGHAIAAQITGTTYYFYDSESGLWKYTSSADWKKNISDEYKPTKTWKIWRLRKKPS
jgi:hypothetical protein